MCSGNDAFWCSTALKNYVERNRVALWSAPIFPQMCSAWSTQTICSTWNTWGIITLPQDHKFGRVNFRENEVSTVFHVEHSVVAANRRCESPEEIFQCGDWSLPENLRRSTSDSRSPRALLLGKSECSTWNTKVIPSLGYSAVFRLWCKVFHVEHP